MKNVPEPSVKSVLIPLGLIATTSATDADIHKKMVGSGCPRILASRRLDLASRTTTLINSNEKMNDIMRIVKSLEESGLLIKNLVKQLKIKQ